MDLNKTIAITGVNGFIGSNLAKRLLDMGAKRIVGLVRDRNFKSRRDILDKISIVYGDLRDFDTVRYMMSHYEVDLVFHLGSVTILRQSVVDPVTTYQTNVMGTLNILEACRQAKVRKIISKSSDKCYGTYEDLPYLESYKVQASPDAYSTSKACMDLISQQYALGYGMDISIVRAGNVYGPGDLNLSRLIPKTILRCLDGKAPILYKGVGHYKREFLLVSDVLDAYLIAAERGVLGEAYNVGGSGYQTVYDTVNKIIELTGFEGEPEIIEKDFIEIKEQYLDPTKIEKLGWVCKHNIDEGLKKTIEWYKQYKEDSSIFFTS